MDWKYKLKRTFANRYAMTAVLFLAIVFWGGFTVLFGVLDQKTACKGYGVPWEETAPPSKTDPRLARRTLAPAATALDAPAKTTPWSARAAAQTAAAEELVTKALENDHSLIELYGAFADFSGRTVVEDVADSQYTVVKLPDGALTFVGDGAPDPTAQAAGLGRLKAAVEARGGALLYLQVPSKLEPENTALPYGVDDPSNACADALLAALDVQGVDHMDLRQVLADAGGPWTERFYKTDHHWTVQTAFLAFQAVAQRLERYDQTSAVATGTKRQPMAIDPRCLDPDSYAVTTLPNWFLGSQGKRVGSRYAGADDFQVWKPKYPTLLHYEAPGYQVDRYGALDETVLFDARIENKDWFGDNPYTYYAGGDYAYAKITNYYAPHAPRILLIRDFYACAITPFLVLASSELVTVDPRSYAGDFAGLLDREKPDVVLVLYSSGMVRSEEYYRFLAQPAPPSKADALRWKTDWYPTQKE